MAARKRKSSLTNNDSSKLRRRTTNPHDSPFDHESPFADRPSSQSLDVSVGDVSFKEDKFGGVDLGTAAAVHRAFKKDLITPSFMNPRHFYVCRGATDCKKKHHITTQEKSNAAHIIVSATSGRWPILLSQLETCLMDPHEYLPVQILKCVMSGVIEEAPLSIAMSLRDIVRRHFALHPPCRPHMVTHYSEFLFQKPHEDTPHREKLLYNLPKVMKMITATFSEMPPKCSLLPHGSVIENTNKSPKSRVTKAREDRIDHMPENAECQQEGIGAVLTFNKEVSRYPSGNNESQSKLSRLFLGYELFIELLETDFFSWLVKYRHKIVLSKIDSWTRRLWPLVMLGTWRKGGENVGEVNNQCRKVIDLYTLCPPSLRSSVRKHLCLIAEVVRIHELNPEKRHPFISKLCFDFAKEVASAIEQGEHDIERKRCLVCDLEPPWLKMCVSSHMLKMGLQSSHSISLKTIVFFIQRNLSTIEGYKKSCHLKGSLQTHHSIQNHRQGVEKGKNRRSFKTNQFGETDLHIHCRKDEVKKVKKILDEGEIDVNVEDNNGWRPIHEAVKHGSLRCVQLLIKERLAPKGNLDIQSGNWEGVTPLMDAVDADHEEIVKLLLKHGGAATIYHKSQKGHSAFQLASDEMKKCLVEAYQREIETLDCLLMSDFEVFLLEQLIFSYLCTFKVKQAGVATDLDNIRPDPVYNFDYALYAENERNINGLSALISRLSANNTNSPHLSVIQSGLKCIV